MPPVLAPLVAEATIAVFAVLIDAGVPLAVATAAATSLPSLVVGGVVLGGLVAYSASTKPKAPTANGYTAPTNQDIQQTVRQPIPDRLRHAGLRKIGGAVIYQRGERDSNLYALVAHATQEIAGVDAYWLNDQAVTRDGNGYVTTAPYVHNGTSRVRILPQLGTAAQAAQQVLVDQFPEEWSTGHRLRGIVNTLLVYTSVAAADFGDVFTSGVPQFRIVARTALVEDPRTAVVGYSRNAACVILDQLTHADGLALPRSMFNTAAFSAAAADCDDAIALKGGGTVQRYTIDMSWSLTEEPSAPLRRMLDACDGEIYLCTDGTYGLRVGKWAAPTKTLTDADVASYRGFARGTDALAAFNVAKGFYQSPDQDFQEVECDPWESGGVIATGDEKVEEFHFPAVLGAAPSQVRRLLKINTAKRNPEWLGTLILKPSGLRVCGERFITLVLSELGINQTFRCGQMRINPNDRTSELDVTAFASSVYDWNAATEEGATPTVPVFQTSAPSTPTGVTGSGSTSGATGLTINWTGAGANIGHQVGYARLIGRQISGSETYDSLAGLAGIYAGTNTYSWSGVPQGEYSLQVRATNYAGRSAYQAVSGNKITSIDNAVPANPTALNFVDNANGTCVITWSNSSSSNYYKTEILRNGTVIATHYGLGPSSSPYTATGVGTYTIRSVNFLGTASTPAALGVCT